MDRWGQLFSIARRQHGAVGRSQAIALGISDTSFTRRVRRERWPRPHRGVYVIPGVRPDIHSRVSAALLAVGGHATATADIALYLHGVSRTIPSCVTLVVPHGQRAPRLHGVQVRRSRTLIDADRSSVSQLACVTPARAFLDAASTHDERDLRVMLIDARQRRVVEPTEVIARVARLPSHVRGRGRLLRAALEVDAVGADSVLTDQVHRRLLDSGLRPDPHPVSIDVGRRRRLHPDITFTPQRVCIECDSLAHHGTQRAIDLDHRKGEAYVAAGWRCFRIGWHRFDRDWHGFVAALLGALERAPLPAS